MTPRVWLVWHTYPYEESILIACFSSEKEAQAFADESQEYLDKEDNTRYIVDSMEVYDDHRRA